MVTGNVAEDRKAIGLSSLKPSEMIKGLDEAAKRAEQLEAREAERKRRGGSTMNITVTVDDTGSRWKRRTNLALVSVVLLTAAILGALAYFANHKFVSKRQLQDDTRNILLDLQTYAAKMKLFKQGESADIENAKTRLLKALNDDYDEIITQMEKRKKAEPFAPPETRSIRARDRVVILRKFEDAWGKPLVFSQPDADTLKIASSTPAQDNPDLMTVTVSLRAPKAPAPEEKLKPKAGEESEKSSKPAKDPSDSAREDKPKEN